jgi:hypothetical protein
MTDNSIPALATRTWNHQGIPCYIVPAPTGSHINGYIQLPENSSLNGIGLDSIPVRIHGGLVFSDADNRIIGFDTYHAGDYWSEEELIRAGMTEDAIGHKYLDIVGHHHNTYCTHWNIELLIAKVESLADQITAYETKFAQIQSIHISANISYSTNKPTTIIGGVALERDEFVSLPAEKRDTIIRLLTKIGDLNDAYPSPR